jgi:hypothetical protein
VFEALFAALVARVGRGLRRKLDGATYLIDCTSLRLNQHSAGWARYSATVCGAKVPVGDATLHDVGTQPALHGYDARQPIGRVGRPTEGAGDRGP